MLVDIAHISSPHLCYLHGSLGVKEGCIAQPTALKAPTRRSANEAGPFVTATNQPATQYLTTSPTLPPLQTLSILYIKLHSNIEYNGPKQIIILFESAQSFAALLEKGNTITVHHGPPSSLPPSFEERPLTP